MDEFVFDVHEVEEKYYLSDKVAKYVLTPGTKNFRTTIETDLDVHVHCSSLCTRCTELALTIT